MNTYTNRKGSKYYLKTGITKTGKPRWWASTDEKKGQNLKQIPEGYEWFENVNAQVFVRKKQESKFLREELKAVEKALSAIKTDCQFEEKGKELLVYTSDFENDGEDIWGRLAFALGKDAQAMMRKNASFSSMLKFRLVDAEKRFFEVERKCFRGSGPDWLPVGGSQSLQKHLERFIPLLDDEESFFSLCRG